MNEPKTPNLGLNKIDRSSPSTTYFDLDKYLDQNWEKVDEGVATKQDLELLRIEIAEVDVPDATLTQKGKVQLSNDLNSNAEDRAATPKAVKAAVTEIVSAIQLGVEQKEKMVLALNSVGVSASVSETWSQLIMKITTILLAKGDAQPSDVRLGKKFSNATGSDILGELPERSVGSVTVTPSKSTQTKPAGIYGGDIVVSGVNFPPANVLEGTTIAGTAGTMPNRGTVGMITPGTVPQTKPAGYYSAPITISGEPNLRGELILKNNSIFGVQGQYDPNLVIRTGIIQYLSGFQVGQYFDWMTIPAGKNLFFAPTQVENYLEVRTGSSSNEGAMSNIVLRDSKKRDVTLFGASGYGGYVNYIKYFGYIEIDRLNKKFRYSYKNPSDTRYSNSSWTDLTVYNLDWEGDLQLLGYVSNRPSDASQGANNIIISADAYTVFY
ncbi:hypothetical protein J3D43_003688 [Paenibacillus xylanexedens]|uniref:tail fiber protein n=1 Tax=Paenibacillus xylanexedens TaxID=528191 RepID=UPI0020A02D79|nr:phage tail protein [Paenibacillus xylanexedens]MCP1425172.1 hypothetical protein [Paenibacillus xylanexedens]